ncbi:CotS family spore coat protein [Falsibacillus albus]|uniref:CotS family spore coat protein n=1 Tax=Falsibacillus albus TaxID=2478915 RepID=A0A3L7JXD6_9BACI|nr:CotS family spore coat protein [Falsibacillus albus]RLQ93102.1 CotS family spore coat protein [Falsibacillus albus]
MKNIIESWEVRETDSDFFVPEYIEQLADRVQEFYDFEVYGRTVVTTKPDKGGAIWKLETDKGPKSLKLLHRRPTRSLFSLGAQEYLVMEKKANVPPIIRTRNGNMSVCAGRKLWFVAEWIEPLSPVSKDLEGAKQLCAALGEFHRLSKGYVPPAGAERVSRLHKWPKFYEKMIYKMDWFRNIALAYDEMPASKTLLSVVDKFEKQAKESLDALLHSEYVNLVTKGNQHFGLVHQDYGWSNGQKGAHGMWIIDLDGVSFDLPIRDLRKLITGTMADLFTWDPEWVKEMILAYHNENPITPELFDILIIDLSLPNEFYKNIKEIVYEPEMFLNAETSALIHTIDDLEQSKWAVLEEIKKDWSELIK